MLKFRKQIFSIMLIIAFAFIFTFFASTFASAQETVITIWHSLPKKYQPLLNTLISEYLSTTHGLVKINYVAFNTDEELHNQLLTGDQVPDIALIDTRWQEAIKNKHKVVYMEDLMKKVVGNSIFISFKTDTFKSMWNSSKSDKKLLSMPFSASNCALMMDEEVLSYFEIKKKPRKWGDLIAIGKKIKSTAVAKGDAKSAQLKSFYIPTDSDPVVLAEFFQVFLWQWDRDIFEKFMQGELVGFDGAEGKAILSMFVEMIHDHQIASTMDSDKVNTIMYISTPREYLERIELGRKAKIVPWPCRSRSKNNIQVLSFLVFDKNDEKKLEKIWQLLYHLCEFKSGLKWALQTPYIPPNKQVTLSPDYFNFLQSHPGMRIFIQQMKNSRVSNVDMKKIKVMKIFGDNLKLALAKKISVDECLEKSALEGNKILDPQGDLRKKKEELKDLEKLVKLLWDKDYGLK